MLGGQDCTIKLYMRWTGVYMDLAWNNVTIASGRLCIDRTPIMRVGYTGFVGDFYFIDTQGTDNPNYTGFGTRWQLVYA